MNDLILNMVLRDASASKNTIRDGGSTALYAAYTVYTVDQICNEDKYTANMSTISCFFF